MKSRASSVETYCPFCERVYVTHIPNITLRLYFARIGKSISSILPLENLKVMLSRSYGRILDASFSFSQSQFKHLDDLYLRFLKCR